jgi:hypothetical protein
MYGVEAQRCPNGHPAERIGMVTILPPFCTSGIRTLASAGGRCQARQILWRPALAPAYRLPGRDRQAPAHPPFTDQCARPSQVLDPHRPRRGNSGSGRCRPRWETMLARSAPASCVRHHFAGVWLPSSKTQNRPGYPLRQPVQDGWSNDAAGLLSDE